MNLASIDIARALLVDIEIDGCLIKGVLIDGGANVNLMMEAIAIDLGMTNFEETPQILRMVDQSKIMPVGKLSNVVTRIRDQEFLLNYIILRVLIGNPFPVLLGRPWLYQAKLKVN